MIINNNFISIVFLGHFNPAILSKEFLKDNKIFITEERIIKENSNPIFKSIEFEKVKIIVDLDRFQVVEENVNDFSKNRVIDLAFNYIKTLKFTPIRIAGINFNFNVKIGEIKKFIDIIEKEQLFGLLNATSFVIDTKKEVDTEKEKFLSGRLIVNIAKDKVVQIALNRTDSRDIYKVNYNYEVRDLDKVSENRLFVKNNFRNIFNQYKEIIEKMFGGL